MKIERINENQIRCTLSRSDLDERHIDLNELAYGSEKARHLFNEMIEKAADEVGFQAENVPLMVEAIPLTLDSIMLIVTRVDDPDELDTRFSRFSPYAEEEDEMPDLSELAAGLLEGAAALKQLYEAAGSSEPRKEEESAEPGAPAFRLFSFRSLDEAANAALALQGAILVHSTLFKDPVKQLYYLCIHASGQEDAFRRTCNTLSEYGIPRRSHTAALAYCEEHCDTIIASRALDKLARLT